MYSGYPNYSIKIENYYFFKAKHGNFVSPCMGKYFIFRYTKWFKLTKLGNTLRKIYY